MVTMIAISWSSVFSLILSFITLVASYRPVQHCKQLGDNGHYSACTSLTQHFNQTTQESDLFVRYNWYKYKESKNGWHAFAIGKMMAGSLMFIMYGDPTSPSPEMTISVRSAEGHHPPQLIPDMSVYQVPEAQGRIPEVTIITNTFKPYNGAYSQPELNLKPTHVGVGEFIVRGYSKWIGTEVGNTSTAQPFLWSSRYEQDFQGDYSVDRSIEMHAFGLGFGFIFADLLNAETPVPMFGAIDELSGHKGLIEIGEPEPPTAAELAAGDFAIKNYRLDPVNSDLATGQPDGEHNPFSDHSNTTPSVNPPDVDENKDTMPVSEESTAHDQNGDPVDVNAAQQAYTFRGKTIRDWIWHLHGLILSTTFFIGYPLGIYLLRSPKQIQSGESFNYHWTVNALATLGLALGAFIGYLQSRSISVTHQFVGIFIVFCVATQMVLGWRHHINFLHSKRKTWMSKFHVGLGRVIMPLGFINILSGMKLRQYGWFTMLLVFILILVEIVFGVVYLRGAHVRRNKMGGAAVAEELKAQGPGQSDDAEEYFQLAEGEDSDESDVEDAAVSKKREQKRGENERLAKLDRV